MRILLLVHPDLRPDLPSARHTCATERSVYRGLLQAGHQVEILALQDSPRPLVEAVQTFRPHVVFNLLEEFLSEACYDFHPVAILEALQVPYTGGNPRGLVLSRPKHVAKAIARGHGIATPDSFLVVHGRIPPHELTYPLIVKLNREDASRGLTLKNIVRSARELRACVKKLNRDFAAEILVEQFIAGKDITVSVLGNQNLQIFPAWQLHLPTSTHISSESIKFSAKSRLKRGVRARRALLTVRQRQELQRACELLFRDLELSGYARFDFRLGQDGVFYFLEANANPNLAEDEDFAYAARARGLSYDKLLNRIMQLGRAYRPRL